MSFYQELTSVINKFSKENDSNTPDHILAGYLLVCLENWNKHIEQRENWYGRNKSNNFGQIKQINEAIIKS